MNFKDCPMYEKTHQATKDIDELHIGHRGIIKELKRMAKIARKKDKFILEHMKDEEVHHESVAQAIVNSNESIKIMGDNMKTLMTDKRTRDAIHDKRERMKEKVYGSIAVVILIGVYNFFMDVMAMKQVLVIE